MLKNDTFQSTLYLTLCLACAVLFAFVDSVKLTSLVKEKQKISLTENDIGKEFSLDETDVNDFVLDISARLTPELTSKFQNLFQTSKINFGVRFEIGPTGGAVFIIGQERNLESPEPKLPIVWSLEETFRAGVPYDIHVIIRSDTIVYGVNDHHEERILRLQEIPRFNQILVGNGFDGSRPFTSKIEAMKLDISLYHVDSKLKFGMLALKIALCLLGFAFGFLTFRKFL